MASVVTYTVIGIFVLLCVTLVFGYSRLLQLQGQLRRAEAQRDTLASAENDAAYAKARDEYSRAVHGFPTNLVAVITGFAAAD